MDPRVEQITQETLTPIVRQALDRPAAVPTTWEITPIHGGWGSAVGGTALYRLAGQTETQETWSVVLKILTMTDEMISPSAISIVRVKRDIRSRSWVTMMIVLPCAARSSKMRKMRQGFRKTLRVCSYNAASNLCRRDDVSTT